LDPERELSPKQRPTPGQQSCMDDLRLQIRK
jgi:hypothetical protein